MNRRTNDGLADWGVWQSHGLAGFRSRHPSLRAGDNVSDNAVFRGEGRGNAGKQLQGVGGVGSINARVHLIQFQGPIPRIRAIPRAPWAPNTTSVEYLCAAQRCFHHNLEPSIEDCGGPCQNTERQDATPHLCSIRVVLSSRPAASSQSLLPIVPILVPHRPIFLSPSESVPHGQRQRRQTACPC